MSFEIMLILVAIGLWLYVTTTAIDLGKGLRGCPRQPDPACVL